MVCHPKYSTILIFWLSFGFHNACVQLYCMYTTYWLRCGAIANWTVSFIHFSHARTHTANFDTNHYIHCIDHMSDYCWSCSHTAASCVCVLSCVRYALALVHISCALIVYPIIKLRAREHSSTQHSWIHNLQLIHSTCDGWRYRIWLKTWRTLTLSIFFGCCRSLFRCFLSIVMFGRRLAMEKSPNSDGAVCVCVCLLLAARFVHTTHFILLILDSVHRIK